jgi:TRAP-type mannitol/chloroaromatic compound transport system permease small subunit
MIGALVAVDFIGFLYARRILALLRGAFRNSAQWWLHAAYLVFAVLIFVGLLAVSVRRGGHTELSALMIRLRWRTRAVLGLSLLAAWPAITSMWLIQSALFDMKDRIDGTAASSPGVIVKDLVDARSALSTLLLIVGSVVGLAALATGALRNALLAYLPKAADEFPIAYVVLYGLYFTAIVGLIFVPVYVALQGRAREIINRIYPIPADGKVEDKVYTGRKNMEAMLQLGTSIKDALQSGIVVLTPLGASLVSTLLPSGKK